MRAAGWRAGGLAGGLLLAASLSGCSSRPQTVEELALAPLGDRAGLFRDARGLEGADREAFFWLLFRSARRHSVDEHEATSVDAADITPEYLEKRVKAARAAQQFPWAPKDEAVWLRSVAMYRVATERMSNWDAFWDAELACATPFLQLSGDYAANPDATLKALLHYLNAEFLGSRAQKKPRGLPDLDPQSLVKEGGGRSTDLAIAAITLMRKVGVPAFLVRCPLIAGEGGGDAWIGVEGTDIWMKPADTAAASPEYFAYRRGDARLPKIFACQERNDYGLWPVRTALSFKTQVNFVLQPATDITSTLPGAVPVVLPGARTAPFLSMFAQGGWLEVAPGRVTEDGTTEFGPCAPNCLYLPTALGAQGVGAAGMPFVLRPDGSHRLLSADGEGRKVGKSVPGAQLYFWKNGGFTPATGDAVPDRSLLMFWTAGPENNGLGKPAGRPFVMNEDDSVTEF